MSRPALLNEGATLIGSLEGKAYVIADRLGVSKQLVSQWGKGTARPSIDMAYRIERLFGIPMSAWCRMPSQAALDQSALRGVTVAPMIDATKPPPRAA